MSHHIVGRDIKERSRIMKVNIICICFNLMARYGVGQLNHLKIMFLFLLRDRLEFNFDDKLLLYFRKT